MGREGGSPHLRTIDACDVHLTAGEFQEACKIGLDERRGQALRQEDNLTAALFDHHREGVVVTEGILPGIEHANLFEKSSTDRRASTPTEIFVVRAEQGDDRGIPSGEQSRRESVVVREKPAHGSGGANARIVEWSDKTMQPALAGASIGIGKDQDLEFLGKLFHGNAEVIYFL